VLIVESYRFRLSGLEFGRSLHFTGVTSSMPEDDSAAITLQSVFGRFSLFSRVSFFSRQKCTSLWIPYSFAPVAERYGSDKPCKVRRTHLKGTKPQGKRGKQQVPKEVRSYSTRRIRRRMSDGYSSTYTLHNRLRQDSFGPRELGVAKCPTRKQHPLIKR
jgi:hypothetical protein